MESKFILKEDDPPEEISENNKLVWKQGYFSFGTQSRIANITACKFITEDIVVIAHRAVAKVYLIHINVDSNTYEILDSMQLCFGSLTYHPDGMDVYQNKIYMSAFSDKCCIIEIINNERLVFERIFTVVPKVSYHGVFVNKSGIFLGGCCPNPKTYSTDTIPIHFFNSQTNEITEYDTGFRRRIKGLQLFDNNTKMIVVSDDKAKGRKNMFDSFVVLYKINDNEKTLKLTDEFIMKNSQVDGVIMKDSIWYTTIHDGNTKSGSIIVGTISFSQKLIFLSRIPCDNFPHGVDIYNEYLMFTCYGSSSFTIKRENQTQYSTLK